MEEKNEEIKLEWQDDTSCKYYCYLKCMPQTRCNYFQGSNQECNNINCPKLHPDRGFTPIFYKGPYNKY